MKYLVRLQFNQTKVKGVILEAQSRKAAYLKAKRLSFDDRDEWSEVDGDIFVVHINEVANETESVPTEITLGGEIE